ncbi:MAG: hypothetical protein BEN19_01995 [Epulopiscium sp. Nuni2H_MBin003]|nr:MAG: hypothetical protein BEN19_01995 [Epulopiscium sp. Nuni2H_MBin003]
MQDIFEEIIVIDQEATLQQQQAKQTIENLTAKLETEISDMCKNILEEAKKQVAEYEKDLKGANALEYTQITEQTQNEINLITKAFSKIKSSVVEQLFDELVTKEEAVYE